jgi:NAD(P)H dehydrogenase (quinone)
MIAITAATGQLGQLVIEQLLQKIPAAQIVAIVRNPAKASALTVRGIAVRKADYDDDAATFGRAFHGVEKVLLISGMDLGRRIAQHTNIIQGAKLAGARLVVFTSLLHADRTPINLAPEYIGTEKALKNSGLSHIILRNGWYHENYTANIPGALAHNAFLGSAAEGRISSAARADYAAAAVAALTGHAETGKTYELAGDTSYTLGELAAELSRQTARSIPYVNLPESEYASVLLKAGLPPPLAHGLASWDVSAAHGALFDDSRALSRLIGRPTTSLADAVRAALG